MINQISANNFEALAEFYWSAITEVHNILDDAIGADGRDEYVGRLRVKLVECIQEMDEILRGGDAADDPMHCLARALENGIRCVNLDASSVTDLLVNRDSSEPDVGLSFANEIVELLARLPGEIPNPMQPGGQRLIIRNLRSWSKIAAVVNEDLSFLAKRIG